MGEFEQVKPYTQVELDQQAVWASEFDQWWESEGQYHRAGGNEYCRTFAWWAWLNREQSKQSKIEQLERERQALHNAFVYMDECRKEWHQGFMRLHKQKNEALKIIENHARYIPQSTVDALEKALRGECE